MRDKTLDELGLVDLQKKLVAEKEVYSQLRFSHAVSPIENPMRIRSARRYVARIGTLVREKELAVAAKKAGS